MFRVEDAQVEPVIFGAAIGAGKFGQWRTPGNKLHGAQLERIVVAIIRFVKVAQLRSCVVLGDATAQLSKKCPRGGGVEGYLAAFRTDRRRDHPFRESCAVAL